MRYALDALGWHEFEHLVQTLLKTRLGLGVEAWGGAGDWGRDAYFTGSLPYPTHEPREGTFCFQCKFVEEANAAGARPEKALVDAVRRERDRLRYGRSQATIYVLFTNAPLSPSVREKVTALLSEVMPTVAVRLHDGNDVCAWLDESPQIARRFPQLFSLRDLDILLGQWVNRDLLARSQAAIEEARDLAQVFVPTGAYHEALSVLGKHHFVVLEGPPEMGNTAIGRMIALAQVLQGWEALECRRARDVERAVTDEREQVFLADDFFGRGEYVPTAVSEWEAELPHILRLLGPRRKLILTSRAHLLNLAKRDLDLHGVAAQRFPTLGEVIVDAGRLTSQEKARILYRHLKQAGLPLAIRELLRSCAHEVVHDEHFTPERIRRL